MAAYKKDGASAKHDEEGVLFFWGQLKRKSRTSLIPSGMKGRSGVSFRTFHAMVEHFSRPHALDYVNLNLVPGPPGNSVSYLRLYDNFLSA